MSPVPPSGHVTAMHTEAMTPTVALVLAGGAGRRFQATSTATRDAPVAHKLDAVLPASSTEPSMTVVERSLGVAVRAAIGPVVLVTGSWVPPEHQRRHWEAGDAVMIVHNPDWERGQITSVQAGLAAAAELGAERVVIGLADQPFLAADAWRAVARGGGPVTVATYGGRRANPVALDRAIWPLLPSTGDEGARALMRVRPDLVREVACPGSPIDIDTAEDLRQWQKS
jgi:molybdenum cofactor cytidylyltransferase